MTGSSVEFHFQTEEEPHWAGKFWRWLKSRNVQLLELKRSYKVSLRSGAINGEGVASWNWRDKQATALMERRLARMLEGRLPEEQATWMAEQLHKILFANRELDVAYYRALQRSIENPIQKEIQIIADDERSLALLTNLPWELAQDVFDSKRGDERLLLGTIGYRPIARIVPSPASVPVEEARVRILCCISNYSGDVLQFDASAFDTAVRASLGSQPGDLRFVVAHDYLPRAEQAFAEISNFNPHIFIFVGHGRSDSGNPRLRFEDWVEVEELAKRLALSGQVLLVILIACDQSRLIQAPAAQSGAVTLVRHGVPSVVAMQGYVDPNLANVFLRVFMESLFITHSISHSAAQGRVEMNRQAREKAWNSDWILPAVFQGVSPEADGNQLSRILGHYQPALEYLLSLVLPPPINLPRPVLESRLLRCLKEAKGLLHISGGIGTGRTHLMRVVARDCIADAVNHRAVLARPIFYIDLDECPRRSTERWFLSELLSRFKRVRSLLPSSTLSTTLSAEFTSTERVGALLAELDRSRVVLAVDHVRNDDTGFWGELARRAVSLSNSLLIIVGDVEDLPADVPELDVPPFSLEDTRAYVRQFIGEDSTLADSWHEGSGGIPLLLDALRSIKKSDIITMPTDISRKKEMMIAANYIETISEALSDEEYEILCVFWWFRGLIEVELACSLLPSDDPFSALEGLVEKGVLSKINRSGKDWLYLARLKADGLGASYEGDLLEAASSLTKRFKKTLAGNVREKIAELAHGEGGLPLLRGVQSAYLRLGNWDKAKDLAIILAGPLQNQSFELFRFFDTVLLNNSATNIPPWMWVQAAGLAREVAELDKADNFLARVKLETLDAYQRASFLNTKATLLKDLGKVGKTEEILALYGEAIPIAQAGLGEHVKDEGVTQDEWAQLLSRLLYNRAAMLQFLAHRTEDAIKDIEQVQVLEKERRPELAAAAKSQEVDMRLSQYAAVEDWDALLKLLRDAYKTLERGRSKQDFAYCCYQYARYYRKRPVSSDADRSQNLREAASFYEQAARVAQDAGDFKRKAAAVRHWADICWAKLAVLSTADAAESLDALLSTLRGYRGDAYALRILRDTLFLRAKIEIESKVTSGRQFLKEASDVSVTEPLNPGRMRDDRNRALAIFLLYLENLQAEDDIAEAEAFLADHQTLLVAWLGDVHLDQPWQTLKALKAKEVLWAV